MGAAASAPPASSIFAVEEGYLIENGELGKPVKGAT